jgi:hypothetical protein
MTQLLAAAGPYTLTFNWTVDGTDTDVGDVTIGIVDGNGDEIVAASTATTNNTDGTYTYSLADQPAPDQLKATWTRSDTGADRDQRYEIIGNWLFTEQQARAFNAKADATAALKPLNSATEYPDSVIADERADILDDLESWTGRGWVPRYARLELVGNGAYSIDLTRGQCKTSDGYQLHRPGRTNDIGYVLSGSVNGTAITAANIQVDELRSRIIRTDATWGLSTDSINPYNVVIEYVYGLPTNINGVSRIAMKLLVDRLVPSAFPDRLLSADTEYGTTRFVQPGGPMGNVTGLPEINSWVDRNNMKILVG